MIGSWLREVFPDVRCKVVGGAIRVEATYEAREAMLRQLRDVQVFKNVLSLNATAYNAKALMDAIDTKYKVKVDNEFLNLYESYNKIAHLVKEETVHVDQKFPVKVGAPPRWRHQEIALEHALKYPHFGLFMEMGTGKSRVVVDAIDILQPDRVLILCPKSVLDSNIWLNQFRNYSITNREAFELDGSIEERANSVKFMATYTKRFIVVMNYEAAWRPEMSEAIEKAHFNMIVADEAHRLKSAGSNVSRVIGRIAQQSKYRFALTGTPLADKPLDVYGVYRFLEPSIFGTNFEKFRSQYAVMGGYSGYQVRQYKNMDELQRKMYSIAYRVTKDVLDLPELIEIERKFELSSAAKAAYRKIDEELTISLNGETFNMTNTLVRILRLQQVTSGYLPVQYDVDAEEVVGHYIDDSRKRVLKEILEDLPDNEPVVVYCRFRYDLQTIQQACKEVGRKYKELSGRKHENSEWSNGEGNVLGVQIASGSAGIDLTRASIGIYYSLDHRLVNFDQSRSRQHRPGQKNNVRLIFIVAKDSIDEDIVKSLKTKEDIVKIVADTHKPAMNTIQGPESIKRRGRRKN